jgi:eukaryotic-like serine/threonine-protein kinase
MRQMTWRGRRGEHLGIVDSPHLDWQLDLSPSGTRAVLVRGGPWPQDRDLWVAEFASNRVTKLTTHRGVESSPAWSPDERRIAYHSSQGGGAIGPFVKDLATGKEDPQLETTERLSVDDWTADGRFLVLRSQGRAVFSLTMTGPRKLQLLADTPYEEDQVQVSPDGRWIAFNSDESEAWEVWVARFPDFTEKRQVSVGGGVQPKWARNGQELFYLTPDGTLMALQGPAGETSTFGTPRPLFKTSLSPAAADLSEYDVTADGQRFVILEHTRDGPQVFTFLINWVDGFNK